MSWVSVVEGLLITIHHLKITSLVFLSLCFNKIPIKGEIALFIRDI